MAEIYPYGSSRKSGARRKTNAIFARWSYLPWQPLAMLALIAGTFCAIQFVDASTQQLSAEMESAVPYDPSEVATGANRLTSATVPMPICKGWPRVNCVVDGDTIWYRRAKIRIADINAPETHNPQCAYEAELGRRATDRMIQLLNAGPFDVVALGGRDEDVYGRKLRIIERGGHSLGQTLVDEGLAERWRGWRRNWCA